jgi:hypothetical protein
MNNESFDFIMQDLLKHQQTMELLQAENRELRQQLTDLRTGRGIFIEINGHRFALNASLISQASSIESSSSVQQQASPAINDKLTTAISKESLSEEAEEVMPIQSDKQEKDGDNLTFLEVAMISEFASALASPLTLLQDPIKQPEEQEQEKSEEEQKAVLRRDLMGSYLLD